MLVGGHYDLLLRDFFAMTRQRLINTDRLVAALHANAVELAPGEARRRAVERAFRCYDRGAEIFVGALEPRCHVHGVAHYRVIEALARADIADERVAGIKADALAQSKT